MALQPWQRNLAVLFGAELLAMTAFSFVDPLVPLYIQKLGDFTTNRAAFWSSMATFSMGVIMFVISPVWGLLADHIGRKAMLLRAMFGGTLVMVLLGMAGSPYLVVALRGFQGLLTGSVAASSALAATVAPRERIPFAIGMIMVAAFTGGSIGPFIGGYIADRTGYEATFFISGGLLFLGGVGVYFGINEHFEQVKARLFTLKDMFKLAFSKQMLPLLAALSLLNLAPSLVSPMISLLIADINPGGQTATVAGIAFSIIGIAAAASSFVFGRLGERYKLQTILVVCCVAAGAFYLPPVWAGSVFLLTLFLTLAGLFRGGISTSSNAIVGLSVPSGQQGIAFGLSQSASSLGGGLGSLAGGSLAEVTGIRPVFAVAAGVFVLVGILVNRWLMPHKRKHEKTNI